MDRLPAPFIPMNDGVRSSGLSSPREYLSAPIIVVTATMYTDLQDPRFLCGLEACRLAGDLQLPVIVVDDSPLALADKVRDGFEEQGRGWVKVSKFKGKGRKAASIRQALAIANKWRASASSERWAAVFTELEKVDFFNHIRTSVAPILNNEVDIVTPGRHIDLFRETYATEQFHSESLGNTFLNMIWRKEGGLSSLDWLFGPICWEGHSISPFYLESNEESWDAQVIPSIRASRIIGARWIGVEISYKHHILQREQEQGSLEFCEKRIMQMNLMTSLLSRAMTVEGRLPIVIVAGAAGNLGVKIVQRLLTTDAANYLAVPSSSRPASPSDDAHSMVKPMRVHLILMDCRSCPKELDLSITHGHKVEWVQCDFTKYDSSWAKRFQSCYVAFLLAAKNPFPEATSQDAYQSMMITSNLFEACAAGRVDRVVYASSNHVVGGLLKDEGAIKPDEHPNFGTKYSLPGASMDSTLYASAKAAGEAQLRAMVTAGRLNRAIMLRIGWCQPGVNNISTISVTGTPTIKEETDAHALKRARQDDKEKASILNWFRGMHLKNEDLDLIVDCCVAPGLESRSGKLIYVNAMSNYPGQRWIVTENELGYEPSATLDCPL